MLEFFKSTAGARTPASFSGCGSEMMHAWIHKPAAQAFALVNRSRRLLALALLCPTALNALAHEEAIEIGRTFGGQLRVAEVFNPPVGLPRSPFPGITGQATGAIGIHSVLLDDPGEDLYQISPAADSRFILVAKQPGMEVWNDHGSGFMNVGESFYIGPAPFDTHPIWNITAPTNGIVYTLTLMIHDVNGVYQDSDPIVLEFTPIAPAQLSVEDNQDSVIITFQGTPDADYVLQAATSLAGGGNWTSIWTNHSEFDGSGFSVQSKAGHPRRFFRYFNH